MTFKVNHFREIKIPETNMLFLHQRWRHENQTTTTKKVADVSPDVCRIEANVQHGDVARLIACVNRQLGKPAHSDYLIKPGETLTDNSHGVL